MVGLVTAGVAASLLSGMNKNINKRKQRQIDTAQSKLNTDTGKAEDQKSWLNTNRDYGISTMSKNNRKTDDDKVMKMDSYIQTKQHNIDKEQSKLNNKRSIF